MATQNAIPTLIERFYHWEETNQILNNRGKDA